MKKKFDPVLLQKLAWSTYRTHPDREVEMWFGGVKGLIMVYQPQSSIVLRRYLF